MERVPPFGDELLLPLRFLLPTLRPGRLPAVTECWQLGAGGGGGRERDERGGGALLGILPEVQIEREPRVFSDQQFAARQVTRTSVITRSLHLFRRGLQISPSHVMACLLDVLESCEILSYNGSVPALKHITMSRYHRKALVLEFGRNAGGVRHMATDAHHCQTTRISPVC